MRLIKMLGLAMVAAVAATAFIGAGSASATSTTLCSAHPEGAKCKAGTELTGAQNIDGLQILGAGKLLTSLGEIHCKHLHITGSLVSATLAASLLGTITKLDYLTCEALLVGCNGKPATVTTTAKPEAHLLYIEPNLGTLTLLKPSTTVEIKCGGIVGTKICKYAENDNVVGQVHNLHEGKALGIVLFNKALITGPLNEGVCPKHGELDATFELSRLVIAGGAKSPIFIAT